MITIYALCHPLNGEVRYIGKTVNSRKRLYEHVCAAKRGSNLRCARWIKSIGGNPSMRILALVSNEAAASTETLFITHYRKAGYRLTNLTDGGEGLAGYKFSDETRHKMRLAKLGKKQTPEHIANAATSRIGRPRPEGMMKKLTDSLRGVKLSPEHRAKLSRWQRGRRLSDETKRRMSESHLRRCAQDRAAAKTEKAP